MKMTPVTSCKLRHIARRSWSDIEPDDKVFAFNKLTFDYYLTPDNIAITRMTRTFERKDDGRRKTWVMWLSGDLRATSNENKLGKLLADLRPKIAAYRQKVAQNNLTGIL